MTKKNETKELEVKATTAVSQFDDSELLLDVKASDLKPSFTNIAQGSSKPVKAGTMNTGVVYDSVTHDIIAKRNESFEFIVLKVVESLVETTGTGDNRKIVRKLDVNSSEALNLIKSGSWIGSDAKGETLNRSIETSYIILRTKDIEKDIALPSIINLSGMSRKPCLNVKDMLYRSSAMKISPIKIVFSGRVVEDKNDKGSWFRYDFSQSRNSTEAEMIVAKDFFLGLKNMHVDTTHTETHTEPTVETTVATASKVADFDGDVPF
jgi:hypothetical protein